MIKNSKQLFLNNRNVFKYKQNKQFNLYKYTKRYIIDFDPQKDYYKILGIDQKSSEKEIKAAYYKLAKKYHPDLNNGNQLLNLIFNLKNLTNNYR